MTKTNESYEQAMQRLEQIVTQIESNNLDIDELGIKLKEAQHLLVYCKKRLYQVDAEVKKLLDKTEDTGMA